MKGQRKLSDKEIRICLEDKHEILLRLSAKYDYQDKNDMQMMVNILCMAIVEIGIFGLDKKNDYAFAQFVQNTVFSNLKKGRNIIAVP